MDGDLLRLHSVLSLTSDEATGVVIPQSDWEKGYGGCRFTLVGRLLSHRAVNFDAMKGTLVQLFQAARGVEVRKISDDRFCLLFNHGEDLRRVLELRPWIFDKNLVVLAPLAERDDPLLVNLDWCPFYVHVHDLKLGQRTVNVVRHIGRSLGTWLDEDSIARDISWFEAVRIRLNLNVTRPLKRALTLCSEHGEEFVVRLTYDRLPNFCYLCGTLGHISRFCELRFQEGFTDPGIHTPCGAWLRAAGPAWRFGISQDMVRPTYVRSSSSSSGYSVSVRRGQHIFGGFRRADDAEGGGASLAIGESGSTAPSPQRLVEHRQLSMDIGQQLNEEFRVAGSVPGLVDMHVGSKGVHAVTGLRPASVSPPQAQSPIKRPASPRPRFSFLGQAGGRPMIQPSQSGDFQISSGYGGPVRGVGSAPISPMDADISANQRGEQSLADDLSVGQDVTTSRGPRNLLSDPLIRSNPSPLHFPVGGRGYGRRARGCRVGRARRVMGPGAGRGSKRTLPNSLQGESQSRLPKCHLVDESGGFCCLAFSVSVICGPCFADSLFGSLPFIGSAAECTDLISDAWHSGPFNGDACSVIAKLGRCAEMLEVWSKTRFSGLKKRKAWLEKRISELESQLLSSSTQLALREYRYELEGDGLIAPFRLVFKTLGRKWFGNI
ncbi:hypothetical protein Salat_2779600 [Sesamum alatum]|uniref:CCHC-type domain-containing protein n=1 Tax=Sesamum alatum TaxID=300844 RepID=A0AAE1XLN6_9LAMI|nr:hypothetical protein Salat_2779600 [Sesamum alatum]